MHHPPGPRCTETRCSTYLPRLVADQAVDAARAERLPLSAWLRQLVVSALAEDDEARTVSVP